MKNSLLLNPFAIISDKKQSLIGFISLIIGIMLIYNFQIQIDIFGIHLSENQSFKNATLRQLFIITVLTITLFIIGKIINKKTRLIDILNTVLLAFIPLYLSAFQNTNNYMLLQTNNIIKAIQNSQFHEIKPSVLFIFIGFFLII